MDPSLVDLRIAANLTPLRFEAVSPAGEAEVRRKIFIFSLIDMICDGLATWANSEGGTRRELNGR